VHQVDMTSEPSESQGARRAVQGEREAGENNSDLVAGDAPLPNSPLSQHRVGEQLPRKPPVRLKRELLALVGPDRETVVASDIADRERGWSCRAGNKEKADARD